MREKNEGLCKCGCVNTFGELIDHFVVGSYETCIMVRITCSLLVVAAANKHKHEKKTDDIRESITLYRSGSAAGVPGMSAILFKGDKVRKGFTGEFILKNVAVRGSIIIPTPNVFMTTEAWEIMALHCVDSYGNFRGSVK